MKKIFLSVIAVLLVLLICIGCAPAADNNNDEGTSGNADTTAAETNPPEPSGTPSDASLINGVDLAKFIRSVARCMRGLPESIPVRYLISF